MTDIIGFLSAELCPGMRNHVHFYRRYGKRCCDLALVLMLAPIYLPLIAFISCLVLIFLGRPIFFTQQRPGKDGKLFKLRKFRTMLELKDDGGRDLSDAKRLTTFGRFLRSTSLDELPEVWNILSGEMSLVGPRPLLPEYLPLYSAEQARRHEVPPGLTGWAQVQARNATTWTERFQHDRWYVENVSFRVDMYILLKTISAVAARRGVAAADHVSMPRFDETPNSNETHGQAV